MAFCRRAWAIGVFLVLWSAPGYGQTDCVDQSCPCEDAQVCASVSLPDGSCNGSGCGGVSSVPSSGGVPVHACGAPCPAGQARTGEPDCICISGTQPAPPQPLTPVISYRNNFVLASSPDANECTSGVIQVQRNTDVLDGPICISGQTTTGDDPVREGELVVQETDLELPGAGIPFQFVRTYRSRAAHLGVLGYNWDFSYNQRIYPTADSCTDVFLATGDGSRVRFHPSESGILVGQGVPLAMRRTFDSVGRPSGWVVRSGDGLRRVFDARGLLQSISDAAGNALTIEWDSYSDLREVLALLPWARAADFDFRITKIHDNYATGRKLHDHVTTGRTINFCYDNYQYGTSQKPQSAPLRLRALALGDDANCAHPVVVFNTGLSSTDFVLDSVSYPHPSGSGNQYGRRYVYEGPSSRSAYLPNPVIDAYCTGACRPQQTCGTPGICDADAQPECVVDLLAAPGHQSEGETVNLCVDTMLDISGCNRQAAGWRTAAGPFAPSVVNATCPPVLDRDRADANVVNCLYLCNAYQFCWTSSEYQGCATNPPPKPNSGFDPAAVKTNWCLQYCSAFAQCERAVNSVPSVSSSEARRCQREVTALCTAESVAGCPSGGTIQASDCQSRIPICKAFTHRAVPFCGDDCTAVCRARYQARDSEGRPAYRYGRGEDLQHKIVEIWATATGAPDRLLQKNQYGSSPALPSFDKVVSQQLGGDDLLDRSTPNTIQFYYFDLVHPTAPKIDPGLRYRKYVDVNFTAIDICPACLLPSLPIPRWFPSLPRIIN